MQPDTFYHIYNHANGSENLFREEENYRYFLQLWAKHIAPVVSTYAYCLMPNHIHFLIRIHTQKTLEAVFKTSKVSKNLGGLATNDHTEKKTIQSFSNLFNSYAKAFNKMYARKGSLFVPNFKRKEIESEEYLTALVHYIHHNPIHHGFCDHYSHWKFSSYCAYLTNKSSQISRDYILDWFGGHDEYVAFHNINIMLPDDKIERFM